MIYLESHPPRVRQFRERYGEVTGCIVVHTAESVMDTVEEDTGAENVAAFIANRSDYGSYHLLVDSDSIVPLVRFSMAAYGDGTGSNEFAIHLSFACSTVSWARMSPSRRRAFIRNGARAAVRAMKWCKEERGIEVVIRRITKEQSTNGWSGFISHAARDPERRTDPGMDFPWDLFFQYIRQLMQEDDMFENEDRQTMKQIAESVAKIEKWLGPDGLFRVRIKNLRDLTLKLRERMNTNDKEAMAELEALEAQLAEMEAMLQDQ